MRRHTGSREFKNDTEWTDEAEHVSKEKQIRLHLYFYFGRNCAVFLAIAEYRTSLVVLLNIL
jgi:hypothetical protein